MAKTIKELVSKKLKDHDIFVRGIFSLTELVLKILQYSIPEDLKQYLDFSTLQPLPDTHIDEKLKISHSDTIYEIALNKAALPKHIRKNKKLPNFRFCFLGEFKSSKPSVPIDFQVEDYVRSIQMLDITNKRPPSIVVPLLIYHGVKRWKHKRLYNVFAKYLPDTILNYISYPKYLVIDIQAMLDEDIEAAIGLGELRSAFLALKHAQDKDFFKQHLGEILKFVEDSPATLLFQKYLKMLLEYSQRRSGLEKEKFQEIVEQSNKNPKMATQFKTMFEAAEEKAMAIGEIKGIEKGIEKGIVIGAAKEAEKTHNAILLLMQTTRLTNVEIANAVGVSIALVEKIRKELKTMPKESN